MGAHQHSPRTIRINAQRENTSDKHSKCEVEELAERQRRRRLRRLKGINRIQCKSTWSCFSICYGS
jgi:hypothetical protein